MSQRQRAAVDPSLAVLSAFSSTLYLYSQFADTVAYSISCRSTCTAAFLNDFSQVEEADLLVPATVGGLGGSTELDFLMAASAVVSKIEESDRLARDHASKVFDVVTQWSAASEIVAFNTQYATLTSKLTFIRTTVPAFFKDQLLPCHLH